MEEDRTLSSTKSVVVQRSGSGIMAGPRLAHRRDPDRTAAANLGHSRGGQAGGQYRLLDNREDELADGLLAANLRRWPSQTGNPTL
jgi:hypothetical protein